MVQSQSKQIPQLKKEAAFMMRVSFITANYVAREGKYALTPFNWGTADRATVEAFHGANFSEKFNELCQDVKDAGFSNIDLWVAHLNPQVATKSQIDEAAAILKQHRLTVVAYTGGLRRPDMTREAAV